VKDGKKRWSGSLPEKAESFCKGAAGQVGVHLADRTTVSIQLADGQAGAAKPGGQACTRLADDAKGGDPSFSLLDEAGAPGIPGMFVRVTMQRTGGPKILVGEHSPGTSVPMMAGVFTDATRNWKSDLAGTRPLETSSQGLSAGALTNGRAYTFYCFTSGGATPCVLVSFDLSGHRQWETTLPDASPIEDVRATDAKIYVSQWGHIDAYGAADGKPVWRIGNLE
jgi:hypothetical protein